MALHLLGSKSATQLACLVGWSQVVPPADLAAAGQAIVSDLGVGAVLGGNSAGPAYVQATATTAGTTALTVLAARAGSPPLTAIRPGDAVIGSAADFAPGTYVVAASGTTATLSQAAISSGTLKGVMFVRQSGIPELGQEGLLTIPNRGRLKLLPGDVVAWDSSGWPIVLSANTISYLGSDWTFT